MSPWHSLLVVYLKLCICQVRCRVGESIPSPDLFLDGQKKNICFAAKLLNIKALGPYDDRHVH